MKAFIVALLFGAAEAFLLKNLLFAVTAGDKKKIVLFFLLKFVSYGVAIALLMSLFIRSLTYCMCGFAVGMPVTAISLFVYFAFVKKR